MYSRETLGVMENPQSRETAWQHLVNKTQDEDKQNKKHNTICVEHHHTQDEDKNKPQHNMCWASLEASTHNNVNKT
jgi:hypothetical protein